MDKHDWVYDDTIWDSISDCFRCRKCGLSKLYYSEDKKYEVKIKCEGNNSGRYITTKDIDKIYYPDHTILVSHEGKA